MFKIRIKNAPAGFIAQAFDVNAKFEHDGFLGCTGQWTDTREDAILTLMQNVAKEIKRLDARIANAKKKIEDLERVKNNLQEGYDIVE